MSPILSNFSYKDDILLNKTGAICKILNLHFNTYLKIKCKIDMYDNVGELSVLNDGYLHYDPIYSLNPVPEIYSNK